MIHLALVSLHPKAKWRMTEDTYESIEWLDDEIIKPTEAEINAEIARLQAEYEANAYQAKRAAEYPAIGDQLDALWKGGDAAAEMLAKIQAIKAKHPKGA